MSLKLIDHLFTGPFSIDATEIRANQSPVVYALVAKGGQSWAPTFRVIELGTSPDEGIKFSDHPRRGAWLTQLHEHETISLYLLYMQRSQFSADDRQRLVEELRMKYNPPNDIVK